MVKPLLFAPLFTNNAVYRADAYRCLSEFLLMDTVQFNSRNINFFSRWHFNVMQLRYETAWSKKATFYVSRAENELTNFFGNLIHSWIYVYFVR